MSTSEAHVICGATTCSSVETTLSKWSATFDRELSSFFQNDPVVPSPLLKAVRYSLLAPGKRVRPYLVQHCCELVGGSGAEALGAAVAIECVHAFSLIHDDLPAMDDDNERRGQPATHIAFGEAVAILAGDALLSSAFEILSSRAPDPQRGLALVQELASATGPKGMIGGQIADLEGESDRPDRERMLAIHLRKTARLMESACRLGAISAGTTPEWTERLGEYGRHLGLSFQLVDDLLDAHGLGEEQDEGQEKCGKQTAPRCVGIAETRRMAEDESALAIAALSAWGAEAEPLRALAAFVVQRTH